MKSLHRVLVMVAACCAAVAVLVPVAALAHGRGRDRRSPSGGSDSQQICREVQRGYRDNGLSDMQIRELNIACQKLAKAYKDEEREDEAALEYKEEELEKALNTLTSACPTVRPPSLSYSQD